MKKKESSYTAENQSDTKLITFINGSIKKNIDLFRQCAHENPVVGIRVYNNIRILFDASNISIRSFIGMLVNRYNITFNGSNITSLRQPGFRFRIGLIRVIEIYIRLILGYELGPFDLVFKDYSVDPLPRILPVDEREEYVVKKRGINIPGL